MEEFSQDPRYFALVGKLQNGRQQNSNLRDSQVLKLPPQPYNEGAWMILDGNQWSICLISRERERKEWGIYQTRRIPYLGYISENRIRDDFSREGEIRTILSTNRSLKPLICEETTSVSSFRINTIKFFLSFRRTIFNIITRALA